MALDLLLILAISLEPERIFSLVEKSVSDRRNRTQMDLLESLELLKSWIKIKDLKLDD